MVERVQAKTRVQAKILRQQESCHSQDTEVEGRKQVERDYGDKQLRATDDLWS